MAIETSTIGAETLSREAAEIPCPIRSRARTRRRFPSGTHPSNAGKLAGVVAGLPPDLMTAPCGDGRADNHAGDKPDAVVGEGAGEGDEMHQEVARRDDERR